MRGVPSRKLMAGVLCLALFLVGAAVAPAEMSATGSDTSTPATTTTETGSSTSTQATTTLATTTTSTTLPATTTVASGGSSTTTPSTTTTTQSSTTAPGPVSGVREHSLVSGCPVMAALLLIPRRNPLLIGAFADAATPNTDIGQLVYRAGGGILLGQDVALREQSCTATGPAGARAEVESLSLLDGAVSADRVVLTRGNSLSLTIAGLKVDGVATTPRPHITVPNIGYLTTGPATRVAVGDAVVATATLALHLTAGKDGLPAGTTILVAAIGLPTAPAVSSPARKTSQQPKTTLGRKQPNDANGRPLKVTPPLALRHYDFPVAGQSDYIDTYGALRTDVPGNWHHGDDIFAALGTPVVAVANGTINRVGWEKLGGWRLWVRDDAGDEFYYAHLSGYAPMDLHSNRVRAGQVIGFIGNTGDAFTTSPHLHFEVHPRQLLHLGYNGAVDPTSYLDTWTHLDHVVVPRPAHPPFPSTPQLRSEARYVFRELLAARHLVPHGPSPKQRPHIPIPAGANGIAPTESEIEHESAPAPSTPIAVAGTSSDTTLVVSGALLALLGGSGLAWMLVRQRNGSRDQT